MSRTVCPNCQGRSLSFIDQRQADGSWAPGEGQRCDNCKAAFLPVTNESTEQGVREAVARCIIGPRNRLPIGSTVTLDQLKQIRWDSATSDERADALWAADAILATLSPDDIRREERDGPVAAWTRVQEYIAELLLALKPFSDAADWADAANATAEPNGRRRYAREQVEESAFAEAFGMYTEKVDPDDFEAITAALSAGDGK